MSAALWLALIGIVVLGAAVRLIGLDRVGFNTDEAVYAGQAAGILNNSDLKPYFPVFRAHPLLFQFILSLVYSVTGISDLAGRVVAVAIGTLTIAVVFALGRALYAPRVGLLSALFLALMPYHVVVTRQVLLDGLMTLLATLTLSALAHYGKVQSSRWLYAAGLGLGLTFLAKETGIILLGAVYLFLALSPAISVRVRDIVVASALCVLVITIFPVVISLAGATRTGQSYLIWQLLRRPNHGWEFYAATALPMIGVLLVLSAACALVMRWRRRTWRETLLVAWIAVPVLFFHLWSVKGFQYLLPIAPALTILSATAFVTLPGDDAEPARWLGKLGIPGGWPRVLSASAVALTLGLPSLYLVLASPDTRGLAGTGGLVGGRETGLWFKHNTPLGTQVLAVGPSIANPIQFYGHRKTHMLSISVNPLERNPAYDPIENPDLALRNGTLHYIVWDAYSASRSRFFSNKLLAYAKRYNGRIVHTEAVDGKEVIVVYEVRP
jgi:4-amino-4-deoxy-L-arabinose transferase-like glycosyltransferase